MVVATLAAPRGASAAPLARDEADALAAGARSRARDAALATWAKRASITDLVWLLRRSPAELGAAERALTRVARGRVPRSRAALRQRLEQRLFMVGRGHDRELASAFVDDIAARPRASVFRVGLLLPTGGEAGAYARAVEAGLSQGLLAATGRGGPPAELVRADSGPEGAASVLAALDTLSRRCGVIVGELLSVPTFALAAGTRAMGLPLVSPTATDDRIGVLGPGVFPVAPSASHRARALARTVLGTREPIVVVVHSSRATSKSFADTFAEAANQAGARIVRQEVNGGDAAVRAVVAAVKRTGAGWICWDAEPREAEALVRQLAAERVSVRVCGGEGFSPERAGAGARMLLEGVVWVGDFWRLPAPLAARLDSLAQRAGTRGSLDEFTRGWLAGHAIGSAIANGALAPEEVASALEARCAPGSVARGLAFDELGAAVPVWAVVRGRSVAAKPRQP